MLPVEHGRLVSKVFSPRNRFVEDISKAWNFVGIGWIYGAFTRNGEKFRQIFGVKRNGMANPGCF